MFLVCHIKSIHKADILEQNNEKTHGVKGSKKKATHDELKFVLFHRVYYIMPNKKEKDNEDEEYILCMHA